MAFLAEVTALAKGLVAAGVAARRPGRPHVARPATSGPWPTSPSGSPARVTVPIYETSSPEQVGLDPGGLRRGRRGGRDGGAQRHAWTQVRGDLPALGTSGRSTTAPSTSWPARARTSPDAEIERATRHAARRQLATLIYTSGTTGRPKGCVLTHGELRRPGPQRGGRPDEVVRRARCQHPAVPAARARVRAVHPGARAWPPRCRMGHTADVKNLLDDLGAFRPTLRPRRAPGLREDLQLGARRRPQAAGRGQDLRRRPRRPRSPGAAAWTPAAPAWCCGPGTRSSTGSSTASSATALGGRCEYAVSGGAPLGARLGPLLPRHRRHRAGGLRTHRDHRAGHGQHAGRRSRSARSAVRCRASRSGSPTTASCSSAASTSCSATATTRGDREALDGRLVPHRRPRRDRRRRLRADHRPQEGDHRHRGRQERRAHRARGPAARPRPDLAVAWSSATSARSSPR